MAGKYPGIAKCDEAGTLAHSGNLLLAEFLPLLSMTCHKPSKPLAASLGDFDIKGFLREHLAPDATELYAALHREVDRHSLVEVLTYTRGNQHLASRVLGIARQTLRTKLRESGLRVTQSVNAQTE